MDCPKCQQPGYILSELCSGCKFTGSPDLVEELSHIDWLLDEIDEWDELDNDGREQIRLYYLDRMTELEIELELRLPPFSGEEAAAGWKKLKQYENASQKTGRRAERRGYSTC